MEVLRHGNTYKEVECKKCGALLSYCEADVDNDYNWDEYFGEVHSIYKEYICCPECKNEIKLKYKVDGKEQEL